MDHILDGLNEAQRAAVTSAAPVLQVLAPPGSGKTKTLTTRAAYLIAHHGLNPRNIIVCTFTNKAAREMGERICGFLGKEVANKLILGTFHSISRRLLSTYGKLINLDEKFGIADSGDTKAILTRVIKRLKLDDSINPAVARSRISALKSRNVTADQYPSQHKKADEQQFAIIYAEYEDQLRVSNLLDFDDLIIRCAELLRRHPACVADIEAVLIDEFQDTNNVQYDLMQLFAQKRETITIVGDPDQSIYGWRNAEIGNLKKMQQQFSDTHVINLEDNYRSSAAILLAAQELIEQDESRPPKRLMATHTVGFRPVLRRLPHASAEASWIVSEIKRTAALTAGLLCWNDYSVLFRSSHHSRLVETALGKEGIPYRMVGGHRFFDRIEVRLVLDYLRVISHPDHNDAVARIMNVPPRGIGATTIQNLLEEAEEDRVPLWRIVVNVAQGNKRSKTLLTKAAEQGIVKFFNVIKTAQNKLQRTQQDDATLADFLSSVVTKIELRNHLKNLNKKDPEDFESRWANVQELVAQASEFSSELQQGQIMDEVQHDEFHESNVTELTSTEDALTKFLANVALSTDVTKEDEDGQPKAQVTLSTIHAAKGLEWPVVFIPAAYDGSIPHSRSEDQDEERRLLYVAMTRAQSLLYLSCPKKNSTSREKPGESSGDNDKPGETTLSRFLSQKPMNAYLDKRGIIMGFEVAKEIATILRRQCPDVAVVENALQVYEYPRDNQWPLSGETEAEHKEWEIGADIDGFEDRETNKRHRTGSGFPSIRSNGMLDKKMPSTGFVLATTMQNKEGFSTSSATMKPTFVSAAKLQLTALKEDNPVTEIRMSATANHAKLGKRKMSNVENQAQGSLLNFFSKGKNGTAKDGAATQQTQRQAQTPLRDISGITNTSSAVEVSMNRVSTMISLSETTVTSERQSGSDEVETKPARTFHTLSTAQSKSGTVLGMRGRSHNGWASRLHK